MHHVRLLSSVSSSVNTKVSEAVEVLASSVIAPVLSELVIVGASLAPVMVMVTVIVSVFDEDWWLSVTVTVIASVTESSLSRAVVSASLSFRSYVHAPLASVSTQAP